ncbi:MAG: PAS domain S-box protein [Bacteroidetes bacterium]|nr:PAS domain S-box protein [Bacteroidota bacterium]
MDTQMGIYKSADQLIQENEELRSRLAETEATLEAIRNGEVDAIVVSGPAGEKIFTLTSAETPYRIIIEEMDEGAVTVSEEGTILYCNRRFEELAATSAEQLVGSNLPICYYLRIKAGLIFCWSKDFQEE